MLHFLMNHWVFLLPLLVLFGGDGSTGVSNNPGEDEDLEWAAHPMNKEGMNWVGD